MLATSSFIVLLFFLFFLFILASFATRAQKKLKEQQQRLSQNPSVNVPARKRSASEASRVNPAQKRHPRRPALPKRPADSQTPAPAPAPVAIRPPMVSLAQKRAGDSGNNTRLAKLRLTPQTLRQQYILLELLQPPLALRGPDPLAASGGIGQGQSM
jgi:hypothetical protein